MEEVKMNDTSYRSRAGAQERPQMVDQTHGTRRGFSAIELMMVLAVAAILAAAALPAYQRYVIRAKRAEAEAALEQLMQQQERYYTLNNSYIAFASDAQDPAARAFKWWSGGSAATSAYELLGKACDDAPITDCIQLIATPGTDQVDRQFRDDDCQRLTLISNGLRLASGAAARCWP